MKIEHDIPKVIHYCWFGGNPLPELALKCIESWKKYCPDYEIKEWNEDNFDLECCDYVKEACEAKKWAFVSDYARFWILYHYGGLYFDTDVEIVQPIDDIVQKGSFMACEPIYGVDMEKIIVPNINPGLGLAATKNHRIYKEILDFYEKHHFKKEDGRADITTIVEYTSKILGKYGLAMTEKTQCIEGIYIYPPEYFCPMNYQTGQIVLTENTKSIHHYTASWNTKTERMVTQMERAFLKYGKVGYVANRILSFPFRVYNKWRKLGTKSTCKFVVDKLKTIFWK